MLSCIIIVLILILVSIVYFGVLLMANAQDIFTAQAALTQAIADLASRVGQSSGITVAESDQILATEQTNTAAVNAILP